MDKRSVSLGLPAALLLLLLWSLHTLHTPLATASPAGGPSTAPELDDEQLVSLVVTATVGLQRNVCAPSRQIRVAPGTRVFYCYRATNTGQVTLTTHTVEDSLSGIIWDRQEFVLAPGATSNTVESGLTLGGRVDLDASTQVTWTASAVTPSLTVSGTAQATIDVVTAGMQVTKAAGTDAVDCGKAGAVVPSGGVAHFCFVVANSGDLPLVEHALVDPSLDLDVTFAYSLASSERLTITQATLAGLGIDGNLMREDVTQTLVNTASYTATTPDDVAASGPISVTNVASTTVSLATAGARMTATVGTDPAECSATTNLTLADPNTQLYYCAVLHNRGNVVLTRHGIGQPDRELVTDFDYNLVPGAALSVTNALLGELGQPQTLGPVTVLEGTNLELSNFLVYTGMTSLDTGRQDETSSFTATANASVFAEVQSTARPSATSTNTPRPSDSRPTNTPPPPLPPTATPVSPLPTPNLAAQQAPAFTPTPTRSYQISLLETPTSPAISPLETPTPPVDAAATLDAEATLAVLYAEWTAVAESPLATPAAALTEMPTETTTPAETAGPLVGPATAQAVVVSATETPPPTATMRPIVQPPPAPTPDYVMFVARTVDSMMMAATWIWFLVGSLLFFIVAGVLAGLSFWRNERHRYDLVDAGLVEDYEFLMPPTPPPDEEADDDWPEPLP